MPPRIQLHGPSHPAVDFAAAELRGYLSRLGNFDDASFDLKVEDPPREEDAIRVTAGAAGGRLTGSNPRSVLFAVYRYLESLGCRWLRPGPDGELVPRLTGKLPHVRLREAGAYPYRTICIEGACSWEHVRDLIDWAAKRCMNAYFLQFHAGTCFWRSWQQHELNPLWPGSPEPFGHDEARKIVDRLREELLRRGWRFEHVGHGWTSRAVGLPGESWDTATPEFTPEQRAMLAELDGERQLYKGIALNTNLCYGTPAVRRSLVDQVVAYAAEHPDTDLVHLWLADGTNNHCECPTCAAQRPSDWYVTLLNELDAALTDAGSPMRVVFLIYVDLLWPPETCRIANPDRFVLMFAPITRSFASSFEDVHLPRTPLPPYQRNHLDFPKDVAVNLQLLHAWQQIFPGDSFDFDYHLTWACYYDLSQFALAQVLHRDIQALGDFGLNGLNSCQIQRVGFPHNLLMETLAVSLWNPDMPFAEIADRWFAAAYGPVSGASVKAFYRRYSELWSPFFEPVYVPQRDDERIRQGLANLDAIEELLRPVRGLFDQAGKPPNDTVRLSWRHLDRFIKLQSVLLPAFRAYLQAAPDVAEKFDALLDWLRRHERELHPGIDVFRCIQVLKWRVHEATAWRDGQTRQTSPIG